MNLFDLQLKKKIYEKKAVKIIAGLDNFSIKKIIQIAKAAELGGATYLDISANPEAVKIIKSVTSLPICVSSIDPAYLYRCILVGADTVEIGNFDCFYKNNIYFSFNEILSLTKEVKELLPNSVKICVTIPHHLLLNQQIKLANSLKNLGINLIQTEGLSTKNYSTANSYNFVSDFTNKASSAISSSYAIANSVDINIIASSGINAISAPIAISYGASGVGIGSALNTFSTIGEMASYINEIVNSVSCNNKYTVNHSCLSLESFKIFNKTVNI